MENKHFLTEKGPKAVGPYSTAVEAKGTVYLSGMLGIDPKTGKLQEGGVLPQATQLFENLRTVLSELGLDLAHVVKTTVFLTNLSDFTAVNTLYGEAFQKDFPARSCVEVSKLPLGAAIEIECVAVRD
jgi:2-iminobutanoate/2-iminopropanoate deaminase